MDQERRQRYRDKLAHADRRLQQVDAWRVEVERSEAHRLGRYKAFQEAAEATTDLAAMVLHDLGQPVRDDYRNLEALSHAGIVSASALRGLNSAIGLRNRLVHEYNGLDEPKAEQAMARLCDVIRQFLEEVERWLTSAK